MSEAEAVRRVVPCEVYSRIVGYLRPLQAWNEGKQQEYEERVTFEQSVQQLENLVVEANTAVEEPPAAVEAR